MHEISSVASVNTEERLLNALASLNYQFSMSVTGWVSYYLQDRSSPQPQIASVGQHRTFGNSEGFFEVVW